MKREVEEPKKLWTLYASYISSSGSVSDPSSDERATHIIENTQAFEIKKNKCNDDTAYCRIWRHPICSPALQAENALSFLKNGPNPYKSQHFVDTGLQ